MRRLDVRCCCDAGKLLGYLDVKDEDASPWRVLRFARYASPFSDSVAVSSPDAVDVQIVTLEVADCWLPGRDRFLAVKSNDTPIEVLRELPNFTEATDEERAEDRARTIEFVAFGTDRRGRR